MFLPLLFASFAFLSPADKIEMPDPTSDIYLAQQESEAILESEEPQDPFVSDAFKQTCRSNCASEAISEGHKCSTQNIADPNMDAFNSCMDTSRAVKRTCEAQCNDMGN